MRASQDWVPLIAQGTCWVAADCGTDAAIGFLAARQTAGDLFIEEISVARQWQARGIGSAMMQAAELWARSANLRAVTLTTFVAIPWNAPAYARRGYKAISDDHLPAYLAHIRSLENSSGLQIEPRCAMECVFV